MAKLIHPVNPDFIRVKGDWGSYVGHEGRDYGWVTLHPFKSREIRAAAPGKVVRVINGKGRGRTASGNYGYGNQVIIQHTDQSWTTYNHFSGNTITVHVGQEVKAGHFLGTMGNTGDVNGIHLHFEVRIGGIGENFRVPVAPYFTRDLPGKSVVSAPAPAGKSVEFDTYQITTAPLYLRKAPAGKDAIVLMPKSTQKNNFRVAVGKIQGSWIRVKTSRGKIGWAHRSFLTARNAKTTAALNIRRTPSTANDKNIIAVLKKGQKVTVIETPTNPNTDAAKWRKIRTAKGTVGWVSNAYLKGI